MSMENGLDTRARPAYIVELAGHGLIAWGAIQSFVLIWRLISTQPSTEGTTLSVFCDVNRVLWNILTIGSVPSGMCMLLAPRLANGLLVFLSVTVLTATMCDVACVIAIKWPSIRPGSVLFALRPSIPLIWLAAASVKQRVGFESSLRAIGAGVFMYMLLFTIQWYYGIQEWNRVGWWSPGHKAAGHLMELCLANSCVAAIALCLRPRHGVPMAAWIVGAYVAAEILAHWSKYIILGSRYSLVHPVSLASFSRIAIVVVAAAFVWRHRHLLGRDDPHCYACGYSLIGLPCDRVRCPECGTHIPPGDRIERSP